MEYTEEQIAQMQALNSMLFIVFLIAAFVVLLGLGILVTFKKFLKKDLPLNGVGNPQIPDGNEAGYFSLIRYDEASKSIVLRQSTKFNKCVVSLVTSSGGKKRMSRHTLVYSGEDNVAAIKLNEAIDEYLIVLESVDKKIQKHQGLTFNFIIAIVAAVIAFGLFYGFGVCYANMWWTVLEDDWPEFTLYYVFPAFGLIGVLVTILGYWLSEFLSKRGGF